ncbi:MAG: hypothetical protein J6R27_01610 [Muribaculaceae bacterium]|nr:hypothetical protein [Muribaculaceae bacterium]
MKKILYFAVGMLIMTACGSKMSETEQQMAAARDSLNIALANQDSLIVLMTEIQQGLNDIKTLENIMNTSDYLSETSNKREEIRNDMILIQKTLKERRDRLVELENRINKANSNNAHLQKALATLREQIAQQEETINDLRNQLIEANIHIDLLTSQVDTLNQAVEESNQIREEVEAANENLINELNYCYYVIGSKSELNEHKIISSGFLRKTKILPEGFEQEYFTRDDKRTLSTLPLGSKKAKVLTNQPESSYTIETEANGMKVLNITNPESFWATTNYVVIQID